MGMLNFVELSCLSVQTHGWCFEISCFEFLFNCVKAMNLLMITVQTCFKSLVKWLDMFVC